MPKISKKNKIKNSGDLSFEGGKNFSISIGEALGGKSPDAHIEAAKNEKPEPTREGKKESTRNAGADGNPPDISAAIIHRESAGRGGRTVTVVDIRPPLGEDAAMNLAKIMRKGLGCGSHVEGGKIILQGDIGDRAEAWLTKQGVKKIVRGN